MTSSLGVSQRGRNSDPRPISRRANEFDARCFQCRLYILQCRRPAGRDTVCRLQSFDGLNTYTGARGKNFGRPSKGSSARSDLHPCDHAGVLDNGIISSVVGTIATNKTPFWRFWRPTGVVRLKTRSFSGWHTESHEIHFGGRHEFAFLPQPSQHL